MCISLTSISFISRILTKYKLKKYGVNNISLQNLKFSQLLNAMKYPQVIVSTQNKTLIFWSQRQSPKHMFYSTLVCLIVCKDFITVFLLFITFVNNRFISGINEH
jgi:hypothetical protein